MTSGKLLRQLVKAAAEGNPRSLEDAISQVVHEERDKQHHLLANDLERILYGMGGKAGDNLKNTYGVVPSDKERGLDLLEIFEPARSLNDVILSEQNKKIVDRVIVENNQRALLKSFGLKPAQKILFYGPPGCGKTVTAEAMASDLSLPLVLVRIDSVISSYLGETAANLRRVFEFIRGQTYVVLFDEFDSLAKERSIAGDHGELKRVVNAFLQMLDAYKGDSILIAATNHEALLDNAIWRRFDEIIPFKYPSKAQIKELVSKKLKSVRRDFDMDDAKLIGSLSKKSHADIERVIIRALKDMVLGGGQFLTLKHLNEAIKLDQSRNA
ncbi:MAG: ATP-binding protein [Alphaproteobacteria bacterium]|nr:ATP-binding protein [Alphaproteobacteria bacterium]